MGYHWEVLGLEPTGDVLAIKKAYAGLLKKNRPDEQPEAYQELRQAYEWALSEAEWRRRSLQEETDEGEPLAWLNEPAHEPAGQDGPTVAAEEAADPVDLSFGADRAGDLLDRWSERLLQCGADEAEACWQDLARELENLPLNEQSEASGLFADFVLQHEALPNAVLANMARYFRWGRDYRDAERLGALRLTELRERLQQDAPTVLRDPQQVERAIELLQLDWVLQRWGKHWGWLYAALAGPHLQRLLLDTDDRQRRALEISFLRWEALRAVVQHAGVLRLLFVLACAMPLVYAVSPADEPFLEWLSIPALFAGIYWFGAWGVGRRVPALGLVIGGALARANLLDTWQSRISAAVAIPIAVALAAHNADALHALQGVFPGRALGLGAILLCVGALLIPPESDEERQIMLPMLVALTLGVGGLLPGGEAREAVAMAVAAAWIALGGWVYHHYHDQVMAYYRAPWAMLRPRAWWGWLLLVVAFKFVVAALAFVLTLVLPVTLRVLARYLSVQTVWLAIGLGVGAAMAVSAGSGGEELVLYALVVAAAALTGLQALAEWSARRVFHGVPDTFFRDDE